jgi:hypothetical protein
MYRISTRIPLLIFFICFPVVSGQSFRTPFYGLIRTPLKATKSHKIGIKLIARLQIDTLSFILVRCTIGGKEVYDYNCQGLEMSAPVPTSPTPPTISHLHVTDQKLPSPSPNFVKNCNQSTCTRRNNMFAQDICPATGACGRSSSKGSSPPSHS